MIETVFVESEIMGHPIAKRVLSCLPKADLFEINRYQELFNKRQQNFRLQKEKPALILAKKHDNFVLPAPSGFGLDSQKNFYFSHMYNCIYDCRYCFLQGMYSSANYLLFVNFEDFFTSISETIHNNADSSLTFFSGYDCDSLAFEKITNFAQHTLSFFKKHPEVEFELRTKSVNIETLLGLKPLSNCVVAFSLSPAKVADALDKKAPRINKRIRALQKLAKSGWLVGLRLDPLIYCDNWKGLYSELIEEIMTDLEIMNLHSVSFGPLRYPKKMYKTIEALYPEEKLFAFPLQTTGTLVSYGPEIENEMANYIQEELKKYLEADRIFQCLI